MAYQVTVRPSVHLVGNLIVLLYGFYDICYRMVGIIFTQEQAVVRQYQSLVVYYCFNVCSELKTWEGLAGQFITNTCSS